MPRPGQPELDRLYRQLQDEPTHGPGTFRYPRGRPRKAEDVPLGQDVPSTLADPTLLGGVVAPNIWHWVITTTAGGTRTTLQSPPLVGPGTLEEFAAQWSTANNPAGGMSLYYTEDGSGTIYNGSQIAPRPGQLIFETWGDGDPIHRATPFLTDGIGLSALFAGLNQPIVTRCFFPIPLSGRFFFKLCIQAGGANDNARGWLVYRPRPAGGRPV